MADLTDSEVHSFLTPLGPGTPVEVTFYRRSGPFSPPVYEAVDSLEKIPSGAVVFKVTCTVPQTGQDGESLPPVSWTDVSP